MRFRLAVLCLLVPVAALARGVHLPADHETNPSLLIGASQMMFHHEDVLVVAALALEGEAPVSGLESTEEQAAYLADLLVDHGLPRDAVEPVIVPVQSMWVRDFGPLFARDAEGRVVLLDPRFRRTEQNPDDADVPTALARRWNLPVVDVPLRMQGGHVLANGDGLVLVSNALVNRNAILDDLDGPAVYRRIQESLPFDDLEIVLPMRGEPTGHLDMFLAFLAVDRLAIARLDPEDDPANAERLDALAAKLAGRPTGAGPLRIVRIDTPAATDGIWRSYTNVAMVDDVVLVPQYPDVDARFDRAALAAYREWLPERTIRGIDSRSLVRRRGALHCVSIPLPPAVHAAAEAVEAGG